MDGTTVPRQQGTTQARRQWTGDGWCDGELTLIDGAVLRRWTAQRQLDGEGRREKRRDGDLTKMGDEERREPDGNVDTAGGGSNKGQSVITL
jgi:hypothetical protein